MTVMVLPRAHDPQPLTGDHDHAVGADDALGGRGMRGCRGEQRSGGAAGTKQPEAALEVDGVGPGAQQQHVSGDGVDEVAVEAQRDPGADVGGTDVEIGASMRTSPSRPTSRSTSTAVFASA